MKKILIILLIVVISSLSLFLVKKYLVSNNINDDTKHNDDSPTIIKKHELFEDYYFEASKELEKMSLEEKVGQLFLVRYDRDSAIYEVSNYNPGGYILFAKDFQDQTKDSIRSEIDNLQKLSKIPLVMAVDEEGGYVTRVSRFKNFRSEKFPSPRSVYDQGGYPLLEEVEREKARLLLSIGINLNLAPVADVSTDPNDFIYNRSFGMDATKTKEFIKNMVTYANEEKISSCLKHFPGYGNNKDTHNAIVYDDRSYDNFTSSDYLPFESGIDFLVPAILVSHNIVNCIDDVYPASLSEKVISELRNKLNFSGIVITDDLAMGAVRDYTTNGVASVLAINAGNDLIITSDFVNMYNEVLNAVNNKEIDIVKIDTAVKRILAWKIAYNMKG